MLSFDLVSWAFNFRNCHIWSVVLALAMPVCFCFLEQRELLAEEWVFGHKRRAAGQKEAEESEQIGGRPVVQGNRLRPELNDLPPTS